MLRNYVYMDKPIYIGFTVLETAKLYMYTLHYDLFRAMYGQKIKLLYTDTDSFIYWIETSNLFEDLKSIDIMDFCDYPKDHHLFNETNKKKIGYIKDECCGKLIAEVVALKSKMYALRMSCNAIHKRAKGVQHTVVKNLTFEQYCECLEHGTQLKNIQRRLGSKHHQIKAYENEKKSLDPFDDKRFILPDKISTLALGHYLTALNQ